jgi:hypothetical protein
MSPVGLYMDVFTDTSLAKVVGTGTRICLHLYLTAYVYDGSNFKSIYKVWEKGEFRNCNSSSPLLSPLEGTASCPLYKYLPVSQANWRGQSDAPAHPGGQLFQAQALQARKKGRLTCFE